MSEMYRIFASDYIDCCDFSDEALIELYNVESYGGRTHPMNGFAVGKKWLSVTVKMWKEDISQGLLFKHELYDDPKFPHWWLDSVLKGV
jgi:hypothetical protein